jgi:uncharacterized protein (TIGR04222 family)
VVTGAVRRRARRGANPGLPGDALELAYVNEGPRLVLFTSLAELGRRGLAESAPTWRGGGIVRVDGPELPGEAPPLLAAVLDALQMYDGVPDLLADERVAAEVDQIGIRLVLRGWYLSARTQTRVKRFAPARSDTRLINFRAHNQMLRFPYHPTHKIGVREEGNSWRSW